jgi:hypothetical protein
MSEREKIEEIEGVRWSRKRKIEQDRKEKVELRREKRLTERGVEREILVVTRTLTVGYVGGSVTVCQS